MLWQQIIEELNEVHTLAAIGHNVGLSIGALGDLKSGKNQEPRYGAGQRLMALYKREQAKKDRALRNAK